ncbi:MAG: ABC transporter permease subunit [Bacteroidetes bacterium]|nr:ABC transporter permease subunit [Bacteroidota bacterium]MCL5026962.1 ABC transporter permease subunit [Chloroflexota bacterium]
METNSAVDSSAEAITIARPARRVWARRSEAVLGSDWRTAYLFVLPMFLLLFGLIGWPFVNALYMSFTNTVGFRVGPWTGLDNYIRLWEDAQFRRAVSVTVTFTAFSILFKFILGLIAALLLHNVKRFSNVLTGLVLLPWIIPEVVTALTWRGLYDAIFGGINQLLLMLGIIEKGIPWLGDPNLALPAVIVVNVWKGIPFFTVVLLAGLKAIDQEMYDAAAVDGANAWGRFIHITLPSLRYVIIVCTFLSTIWTFNAFGIVYMLTGGGPGGATRMYSILAYEYALNALRTSAGVAVAMTMAPVLAIFIFILSRYMRAGTRATEATEAAARGTAAIIYNVVSWPFAVLLQIIGWLLGMVSWGIEIGLGNISRGLGALYIRGNEARQLTALRFSKRLGGLLVPLCLVPLLFFELFPFYWIVTTAFKTDLQIRSAKSIFWPEPWTMLNFQQLFGETAFLLWFQNTLLVALIATLVAIVAAGLGAYALVRLRWRGAGAMATIVLVAYLMPGALMFIPLYQIFQALHITNSLLALMLAYPTFTMPFASWMLMGYYRSIPEEIEESALIDGCNRLQAYFRVVLPLTAPAVMAAALYTITQAWNEFLFAWVFLRSESNFTLSIGLAQMVRGDIFPWGLMMAASLAMAIPVVVIYIYAQKFMVEGLTAGAVKGAG